MPISVERATRHVGEWSKKLAPFPTRSNWPVHLFHTCQLEVAIEIIRAGKIVCRGDVPKLICDVANQGALWNNPDAHQYVRLYFRPRNGFHLKTEGVKALGDPHRVDPHMSIPIAFAFDFVKVITAAESAFVPGNFAKTGAAPQTNDHEFDNLQFESIYHDSALSADKRIEVHNWRMSEVVVKRMLSLSNLTYIICRTVHEERTLRHALGAIKTPRIIVEQKGSIFMRFGMFIDEIYWASNMLHMKFHGPTYATKETYAIKVICRDAGSIRERTYNLAPDTYHFPGLKASKEATWRIEFEGCAVYDAPVPSASGLVVA